MEKRTTEELLRDADEASKHLLQKDCYYNKPYLSILVTELSEKLREYLTIAPTN